MKLLVKCIWFIFFSPLITAQFLDLHKNDGTNNSFILNQIDSISFTNSLLLELHRSDGIIDSFSLSQIDSITFSSSNFSPCPADVSHAGKLYNVVQIGTQCWLKENLDIGDMIKNHQDPTNNGIIEKYCYDNDSINCLEYGGLYSWDESMQFSTIQGSQGICPNGWHIPTQTEFRILREAVNNDGNALKEIGQGYLDGAGTNTSGFSILLAGLLDSQRNFWGRAYTARFWSSTEYSNDKKGLMDLYSGSNYIYLYEGFKLDNLGIRCMRD